MAPSRVRRVARDVGTDALRASTAPRRTRTGALDVRGASFMNGNGVRRHSSGIPTNTSGCSPKSDGSRRNSSGSPRHTDRCRRHAQGCRRCSDGSSRSSQSCRASSYRRSRSSDSVPRRADGCSRHGPGQDIADTLLRVGCQAMAAIGCLSFFKSFSSSGRQALTASKGVEASVAGLAPPGLVLACTSCMRGRRRNAGGSKHESSTPGSVSTIPRSTSWSHRRT